MADQRMIGDILSERRHDLGLSIERVAADTKLQRRMIEAFEDSNFDEMPPKGYAQASLASYARYLGLSPTEILRVYEDQLRRYERDESLGRRTISGRDGRRGGEDVDLQRGTRASRNRYGTDRAQAYPYGTDSDDRDRRHRSDYDTSGHDRGRSGRAFDRRDETRPMSPRGRNQGLYRDGYDTPESRRESPRRSGLYADEAASRRPSSYEDSSSGRRRSREGERDRSFADDTRRISGARERRGHGEVERETQVITLDDGYQGGSGGRDARGVGDRAGRTGNRTASASQRQSVSEVLLGLWESIRGDNRTFIIICAATLLVLVVVLAVAISSCTRGSTSVDGSQDGNIPVTPVSSEQGAGGASDAHVPPLVQSIDLNALPLNSFIDIAVSADAPQSIWIEAFVDDAAVLAENSAPGSGYRWYITRNAVVKFQSIDGIAVTVNGISVTPVADNGMYTLTMSVAQDQTSSDSGA